MVYARPPAVREEHFLHFWNICCLYALKKQNIFWIPGDFARKTHLYRLGNKAPRAAMEATQASLLTDWPTLSPCEVTQPAKASHPPAESAPAAGARILEIRPIETLSIRQITCRGGRAGAADLDHHVAVARSDNPYVNFLLERYKSESPAGASVNLVSAERTSRPHPPAPPGGAAGGARYHDGLRSTFRWEEDLLRALLQQLSRESRLSRVPVRFLDGNGRLQRDSLYSNQNPGSGTGAPFSHHWPGTAGGPARFQQAGPSADAS